MEKFAKSLISFDNRRDKRKGKATATRPVADGDGRKAPYIQLMQGDLSDSTELLAIASPFLRNKKAKRNCHRVVLFLNNKMRKQEVQS
jgi:hypothetical protein